MKKVLTLLLFVFLTGCATEKIIYIDRPVPFEVPVIAEQPEPAIINEPFLPVWLIGPENITEPDKIARAYVKSIILLQGYSNRLQCALDTYRKETPKMCKGIQNVPAD